MIVTLTEVLDGPQLKAIDDLVAQVQWVPGASTATGSAAPVKNNEQARHDDPALQRIRDLSANILGQHELFRSLAMPLRMVPPVLSRYGPGMAYGDHIDNPVMPGSPPVRSDLAMTLFLSPLDSYEGGELVISSDQGGRSVRLERGSMVLYPATTSHRVAPVTGGTRLALVTWVQSLVRNHEQRLLLAELSGVESGLRNNPPQHTGEAERLQRIRATLMRMWADT